MFEEITFEGRVYAMILRSNYRAEGVKFFTPDSFSQQLGYMNRPKGYRIKPHTHKKALREIQITKEVLIIKSGKVRVDFYNDDQTYLQSRLLNQGDVMLLAFGSHGFEMIEASEIIEVKQGPFMGDQDKTHFEPTLPERYDFGDVS